MSSMPLRILVVGSLVLLVGCSRLDRVERRTFEAETLLTDRSLEHDADPIKAHMPDGSVYVFTRWLVSDSARSISGFAAHLGPDRDTLAHGALTVPLDSVALVETNVRSASDATVYLGILTAASVALAVYCITTPKACFGSCPTIYSDSPDGHVLEAESFSHSIAPLFEMRDVDRISTQPDSSGLLRLEIRNEALETHYINHLELLEVAHEPDRFAVPDGRGGALLLDEWTTDMSMTDRAGRDVTRALEIADGVAFETDPERLSAANPDDAFDHLDIVLPAPASDSAAVLLRLRASLLSTVLFYDFMLGAQGVGAIDWLTRSLDTISGAVQIGEFYTRWMGVRIAVRDGGTYHDAGRIGGAGPIAWEDAAVVVPVPERDSLRLRVSFLTDAYRIDRVAIARSVERYRPRTIPLARVESPDPTHDNSLLEDASAPDERYLTTYPGTRLTAVFETGARSGSRTYFLASQGYYIEWIRREWMQRDPSAAPPLASDEMLRGAYARWRAVRTDYEDLFFRTRIPVR